MKKSIGYKRWVSTMCVPDKEEFYTPEQCLELRELGIEQNQPWLWHKPKHLDGWVLWGRNSADISLFGDKSGYKRWVSAYRFDNQKVLDFIHNKHSGDVKQEE